MALFGQETAPGTTEICDGTGSLRQHEIALKTARLEIAYEQKLGRMKQLFDSESIRRLRVDRALLEADHDWLYMRFEHVDEERVRVLEAECTARQELTEAHTEIVRLQTALRSNARHTEDLKVSSVLTCHRYLVYLSLCLNTPAERDRACD
jgi:hypothetical protein